MSDAGQSRARRHFDRPSRELLGLYARDIRVPLSVDELDGAAGEAAVLLERLARLDALEHANVALRDADRDPGREPTDSEDPYNAIIRLCEVRGAGAGPLADIRVGVKDNIAVAGVPMTGGEVRNPVPVPSQDAVVVERLLDAGATITAKTNIASPLIGSAFGVTRNPCNPHFSPGFSSSGSAAAVAAQLVDIALGTDVAGSVRIPSAWCGIVGMKASHGLIPSSYGVGNHAINDIGPITATVADNAAMLATMAADMTHAASAAQGVEGLRVGIVAESCDPAVCSPGTLTAFERATSLLADLGAELVRVAVPMWGDAAVAILARLHLSDIAYVDHWLGEDADYEGRIDERVFTELAVHRRSAPRRSVTLLIGEHLRRNDLGGPGFVRAQNLGRELRRRVDILLSAVDLLVTPTTVVGPFKLSDARLADAEASRGLLELSIRNTAPLNLSGHPALTVPSGLGDDNLPTGMQIVGRRFDEHTVYRAGLAFEAGLSLGASTTTGILAEAVRDPAGAARRSRPGRT